MQVDRHMTINALTTVWIKLNVGLLTRIDTQATCMHGASYQHLQYALNSRKRFEP